MRWLILSIILIVTGCSDRTAAPVVPIALSVGSIRPFSLAQPASAIPTEFTVFYAPPELTLLKLEVSIPPNRETGTHFGRAGQAKSGTRLCDRITDQISGFRQLPGSPEQ